MVPLAISGPVTIASFVLLGIFAYPRLLRGRHGAMLVAVATLALTALYFVFAADTQPSALRAVLALAWALLPVLAGFVIYRLPRGGGRRN